MQINKRLIQVNNSMNTKYFVIVAAMTAMLIGATALATDDAFADGKKKYKKSQALSQANACGNGFLPENIFCQNLASQIQGDGNAMNIIGVQ
jgi:hypothetical protein